MNKNGGDTLARGINPASEEADAPQKKPGHDSAAFAFVRQLGMDLAKGDFDLPPFPDTALKVQSCIRDPDSDIQSLAAIVATEPGLAARLMRMANSAMMRRGPMEVTDIGTAISRVGMDMVQSAAVSFAAREAFKIPEGSLCDDDLNEMRSVSTRVAAISYVLARHSRANDNPDEAMLAGLMNSVGKFYIFTKSADHPELFSDRSALDNLVSQWHTGVARAIVESWEFPESIALAVDEQELVERDRKEEANLSDILFVANYAAHNGMAAVGDIGDVDALARLQISPDELAGLLVEHEAELQSMIEALGN